MRTGGEGCNHVYHSKRVTKGVNEDEGGDNHTYVEGVGWGGRLAMVDTVLEA